MCALGLLVKGMHPTNHIHAIRNITHLKSPFSDFAPPHALSPTPTLAAFSYSDFTATMTDLSKYHIARMPGGVVYNSVSTAAYMQKGKQT